MGAVVGRNDYAVEVAVGVVVDEGLGYVVEVCGLALASGGYLCCIAFLRASLAPY
jgi:hypothetical protein